MKEDLLLESFQVEELEKRYEMGWGKPTYSTDQLPDRDGEPQDPVRSVGWQFDL